MVFYAENQVEMVDAPVYVEGEGVQSKEFLRNVPKGLALTGRVKDWLESPESRLPVSCTVFSVEDSMEGKNGIEDSWIFTSYGLRNAAGVAVDLSKLRPRGTENNKGLTASGVVSFAKFYSLLNQELRRGGIFKNGAVTLYCEYDHPDCESFITAPASDLEWVKRAVYVDEGLKNHPIKAKLAQAVNEGKVWLAKKMHDKRGNRLYSNVCLEILIPHRGSCLLSHINLGILKADEFREAYREGMRYLCRLHAVTGLAEDPHYLPPSIDKQVGLGVIGLANFLANENISYAEFVAGLERVERVTNGFNPERVYEVYDGRDGFSSRAEWVASELVMAFHDAAKVARSYGMERAFTVAPTATMSFNHLDREGFTTTPEISPPIASEVERDSGTFGVQEYIYPPNVETAKMVGWKTQWKLLNIWQRLMNSTGLAHSISANIWDRCKVDEKFIDTFLDSDIVTTYYRIITDQEALNKSKILTPEDDIQPIYEEEEEVEMLTPANDKQYCIPCGG